MKDRLEELLLGSQSRTQLKAAKERKKKDRKSVSGRKDTVWCGLRHRR